jgi:hypothetical protein
MVTGWIAGRPLPGERRDAVEREEFAEFYAESFQRGWRLIGDIDRSLERH